MALLWSLLLAALLALLPCTASARAATPEAPPSGQAAPGTRTAVQGPSTTGPAAPAADRPGPSKTERADRADRAAQVAHHTPAVSSDAPGLPYVWCAVDGSGQRPGHGCSGHSFCGPDSHLPNAPPQPGPVVLPRSIAPSGAPAVPVCAAAPGSHHAPDLHVLQVHRS
ncbi:hypothetical protein [Kitasatospora sp. NPDC088134]|uniref:hypothetical protein n=1 Tax=Kitasatospora sp. NPDC088134 TaxID=3364071 RepID=UPI0038190B54